uniref:Uncharacterized protein n=1 Tax=Cucumis melo TaxID=3656 RepID=A0A9I9ED89_CUCME
MAEFWFILHITGQLVFTRNQEVSSFSCISECTSGGQIKEVVCAQFCKWFCFEGYLSLFTGNQIYMSSDWQVHHMKVLSRVDRYRYKKALFVGFTPSFGLR